MCWWIPPLIRLSADHCLCLGSWDCFPAKLNYPTTWAAHVRWCIPGVLRRGNQANPPQRSSCHTLTTIPWRGSNISNSPVLTSVRILGNDYYWIDGKRSIEVNPCYWKGSLDNKIDVAGFDFHWYRAVYGIRLMQDRLSPWCRIWFKVDYSLTLSWYADLFKGTEIEQRKFTTVTS